MLHTMLLNSFKRDVGSMLRNLHLTCKYMDLIFLYQSVLKETRHIQTHILCNFHGLSLVNVATENTYF